MIPNYIRPQLLIRQLLEVLPQVTEPSMNTFVYGPQYKLNRYSVKDERSQMQGTAYNGSASFTVEYEGVDKGDNVDLGSVDLNVEDAELTVANFDVTSGANKAYYTDRSRANEFKVALNTDPTQVVNLADSSSALTTELDGRPVRAGDIAVITNVAGALVAKRQVVSVSKAEQPSSVGAAAASDQNVGTTAASETIESQNVSGGTVSGVTSTDGGGADAAFAAAGSNYGKELAELLTFYVTEAADNTTPGAVKIRSASGNFEADDVAVTWDGGDSEFDIALTAADLTFHIAGVTDLTVGDILTVLVKRLFVVVDAAGEGSATGTYQNDRNSNIRLTCVTGGITASAEWRISDSEGLEDAHEVTGTALASGVAFGTSGVTVTLDRSGELHRVGDIVSFPCEAAGKTGESGIITLSAPAGDPGLLNGGLDTHAFGLEIRQAYDGVVSQRGLGAPSYQWEADSSGVVVAAPDGADKSINIEVGGFNTSAGDTTKILPVADTNIGDTLFFASYRELVPAKPGEGIVKVSSTTELSQFGEKDQKNPLGLGASMAITGSQGKAIYVGRVESNDVEGFTSVLKKAENIEALYAHVPMSDDYQVQLLAKDHVNLMSTESHKKWRRAYVGTANPGDYKAVGVKADGSSHTATIGSDGSGNVVVTDTDGTFVSSKIAPGDLFRINFTVSNAWGDSTYDNASVGGYLVDSVVDEETLILKSGPANSITAPSRYEIWKKDNASNISDYVAGRSASFGSRRLNNVFCDGGQYINARSALETLHPMFLAAEIAGLRTAVAPQQGLTNTEIASISAAPAMYIKFDEAALNEIASNGTFIVTQEYQDGPRFIRHQLTTKTDSGNLYYEDSVGVNVDEISLQVKHALRPYIGKRNVNPGTIEDIFFDMQSILRSKLTVPAALDEIGPALIGFTDLRVSVNDTFKDRIDVTATLNVPIPLNVIDVTLNAVARFDGGELSLESLGIGAITTTVDSPDQPVTLDLEGNTIS